MGTRKNSPPPPAAAEDPGNSTRGHRFTDLVAVMERLLGPDGCPWDREQTLETLIPYLIEETYEVVEAIEQKGAGEHCEELGDLLMQVVFQASLRRGEGAFEIDDVIVGITEKLVRRHPHVFADAKAANADEVWAQWEEIKAAEKRARRAQNRSDGVDESVDPAAEERVRVLDGLPATMPALPHAQKISARVARVGFDAPDSDGFAAKVREELQELEAAAAQGDADAVEVEIGDLLTSVVNLARKLGCDAETALRRANRRFSSRFAAVEDMLHERGKRPENASLGELDTLWEQVKEHER